MFLIIDTSAKQTLIALADHKQIIDREIWAAGRELSIDLLPKVDALLTKNKVQGDRLEYLVVLTGPGSYTGLRIGVTLANALGYAWQIPVRGVSRFEAWTSFYDIALNSDEIVVLDADHDKIFLASPGKDEHWTGFPKEKSAKLKKAKRIYTDLSDNAVRTLKKINPTAEILLITLKPEEILESLRSAALRKGKASKYEPVQPLYIRPPSITPKRNASKS